MDKIQELTTKLYEEGVLKGNEQAEQIINEAKAQESQILKNAEVKAAEILNNAKRNSDELKTQTSSELKMYASQSVEALRTEITNLITDKIATRNAQQAMNDPHFMQQFILKIAQNWASGENVNVGVEDAESLRNFVAHEAAEILDNKLQITNVKGMGAGFWIAPEDGSYKVKFGEEEITEYLKDFLRPYVKEILF